MRIYDIAGKRVVIWGAGRESSAVVGALERLNIKSDLSVVDDSTEGASHLGNYPILRDDEKDAALASADVIVRSPGISRYRNDVTALQEKGIEFTTATRLWFAENFNNVIGVTGTKGKSTTASLIARLLSATGLDVELAGNIGRAPIDLLGGPAPDWWVLELSSYQASDLERSPPYGVLTSLSPEHLDWHRDEATYRSDKLNLFGHDSGASVVVNAGDPGALAVASAIRANIVFANQPPQGRVEDGFFVVDNVPIAPTNAFQLLGRHNRELACVALTALSTVGVDIVRHADAVAHALSTFEPLAHRLEVIAEIDGIAYVDDSISTTPAATIAALSAFDGRRVTVLIGGFDRGLAYDELARYVVRSRERIKVITLPDSGPRISEAFAKVGDSLNFVYESSGVAEAVSIAANISSSDGSVVLLSPGAPSFGHFNNYIERGEAFRSAVDSLLRERG